MKTTRDSEMDDLLSQVLREGSEPADAGFSLRVMAALPAQKSPRPDALTRQLFRLARAVQWSALIVAAIVMTALQVFTAHEPGSPGFPASMALIALVVFWSLPTRWTRL
ncbi:MAG TPA: hypothetical protein VGM81_03645 [Burkholderiaceae bacterium]|jgi:hypothetical protein